MKVILNDKIKCQKFLNLFQNLKLLAEHVRLYVTYTGIWCQGMDSAHTTLFELNLGSNWFDKFELENMQTTHVLGISLNIFSKILSTRNENQNIVLNYKDGDDKKGSFKNLLKIKNCWEKVIL